LHQNFRCDVIRRAYGGISKLTVTGRGDKGRRRGGGTPGGSEGCRQVRCAVRVVVVVMVVGVRGGGSAIAGPGTVSRRGMDRDGGAVVEKGRVFQIHLLTQTHIAQFEMTVPIEKDVVGLEVPVDVAELVDTRDGHNHLGHVLTGGGFREGVFPDEEGHQVPTGEELHHHVEHLRREEGGEEGRVRVKSSNQISLLYRIGTGWKHPLSSFPPSLPPVLPLYLLILEGIVQRDNPWIIRNGQNVSLRPHMPYLVLPDHGFLNHGLHSVYLAVGLLFHQVNLQRIGGKKEWITSLLYCSRAYLHPLLLPLLHNLPPSPPSLPPSFPPYLSKRSPPNDDQRIEIIRRQASLLLALVFVFHSLELCPVMLFLDLIQVEAGLQGRREGGREGGRKGGMDGLGKWTRHKSQGP